MQNNAKQCKNSLFEAIEYEEIAEKDEKFAESWPEKGLPVRTMEWEIPSLGETVKREAKKFRLRPAAVWIGQAIGHGSVLIISLVLQAVWFLLSLVWIAMSVFFMSLSGVLEDLLSGGHGYGQRHTYRPRQRQDIDPLDVPTGWDAKGQAYVRKKMRERERQRQRQGHVNNVNVNVNVNIENH